MPDSAVTRDASERVSVTIVNHQSRDLLRQCLRSLHDNPYTLGPMEIVVIDNASEDGSIAMVREEFPGVEVLEERRRRGFGSNQNRAVAASTGELVYLLNPDARVLPGTIDRLVDSLQWAPDVAAAGGPVITESGSAIQSRPFPRRSVSDAYATALGFSRATNLQPASSGVYREGWLSGGAFLITRSAFDQIGGFDEDFFMYAEDVDLFARLIDAGYAFSWVEESGVTHPMPTESPASARRRAVEMVRADIRYVHKHSGRYAAAAYRLALALNSAVRLVALSIPGARHLVSLHDGTIASRRVMYQSRLRAALSPHSGEGFAELADEWNQRSQAGDD